MSKLNWKGGTLLAPVPPVIVTCSNGEENNALTIGWTGIINSDPPKTYISVRPERHSYQLIKQSGEFTINLMPSRYAKAVDCCGVKSGRDVDKFKQCGLHYEKGKSVACPMVSESPLTLECKVTDELPLGTHTMFVADIVSCNVEETVISQSGKLRLDKADLLAYCHGEYFRLGEKLGSFGFSVMKPKTMRKKGIKR